MSTDIEEIKKTGKFTWGQPVKWHEIGPYTLLEFHPYKHERIGGRTNEFLEETEFHGWLDGKDCHESWPSLETGIIGLIRDKYKGAIGLEYFFCRGIQAPPYEEK